MSLPDGVFQYRGTASTRVKDRDRGPDNAYIQGTWMVLRRDGDHAFVAPVITPFDKVPSEPTHAIRLDPEGHKDQPEEGR